MSDYGDLSPFSLLVSNYTSTVTNDVNKLSPHNVGKISIYVSLVCGFISVLSMIVCKKWRARLFSAKLLLLIKCIFELITYIVMLAFFNSSGDPLDCRLQTSFIQFFFVGANIYLAFLMIETNILIKQVVQAPKLKDSRNKQIIIRHFIYNFVAFGFGIPIVIWINVKNDYEYNGIWCYVKNPFHGLVFAILPLWTVIVTIIICDISTVTVLYRLLSRKYSNEKNTLLQKGSSVRPLPPPVPQPTGNNLLALPPPQSSLQEIEIHYRVHPRDEEQNQLQQQHQAQGFTLAQPQGHVEYSHKSNTPSTSLQNQNPATSSAPLSKKSYSVYLRLIIIPIIFTIIWIPTSVKIIINVKPSLGSPMVNRFISYAVAICAPSGGFWNAVIWVFTDNEVKREWNMFFDKILNSEGSSTSS